MHTLLFIKKRDTNTVINKKEIHTLLFIKKEMHTLLFIKRDKYVHCYLWKEIHKLLFIKRDIYTVISQTKNMLHLKACFSLNKCMYCIWIPLLHTSTLQTAPSLFLKTVTWNSTGNFCTHWHRGVKHSNFRSK